MEGEGKHKSYYRTVRNEWKVEGGKERRGEERNGEERQGKESY